MAELFVIFVMVYLFLFTAFAASLQDEGLYHNPNDWRKGVLDRWRYHGRLFKVITAPFVALVWLKVKLGRD